MFVQILCIEAHFCNILSKHFHFPHYRFYDMFVDFFNRSMMTSRTTMLKNNRAKLAKLFMLVILIGLFFRQWFTHFCDIYVFLLQFRRKFFFLFLNPQLNTDTGKFCDICLHNRMTPENYTKRDLPELENIVKHSGLKLLHQNIRGIFSKKDLVRDILFTFNINFFALSELFLSTDTASQSIDIPGYTFEKKIRSTGIGGGLGAYLKEGTPL